MFVLRLKSNHQSFYKTTEFFSHLKSPFLLKKSHFQGLFKSQNGIFSHGQKIFVQDNLGFVLDKNYFVHAEGRGISRSVKYYEVFQNTRFDPRSPHDS